MKYFCNPLNINYRYQFYDEKHPDGRAKIGREAADPSLIFFKGRYYIFASMTLGVWVSDDLASWENHRLPDQLPLYDYAPDVRVIGEWVYLCASSRDVNCDRFRTKNVLEGPYEKIPGTFPFWDPNLFVDDDGRVYFYWGCSDVTPIWGCELDPETMLPITEPKALIAGHPDRIGFERVGENNSLPPGEAGSGRMPYVEGAWVDRFGDRYYLQYAVPGTEFNIYADGVYVSGSPLGPYELAEDNPFSFKPGGFMTGAGHGSTMLDVNGRWWHTASMRISVNHMFERRVGLWRAGFDRDGALFCNQRYGDWPIAVDETGKADADPWAEPEWMLMSAGRKMTASSFREGCGPQEASREDARTWWSPETAGRGEWLMEDLGDVMRVNAVQVNFADDYPDIPCPGKMRGTDSARFIDDKEYPTQWKLEGSEDGESWFVIADKSAAETDLPHDLVVSEEGWNARFLKLSALAVPYGQIPCISGLRVFGRGNGCAPLPPSYEARRTGPMDMQVDIGPASEDPENRPLGWNILFGSSPDRLYHSLMTFEAEGNVIGALVDGRKYFVRVDAFNENGITHGEVRPLEG